MKASLWWALVCATTIFLVSRIPYREPNVPYKPDYLDRRIAADKLQTYGDYVGIETKFESLGWEDETLLITGSLFCEDDLPQLLPGKMWKIVEQAQFKWVRCERGNKRIVLPVK